MPKLSDLRIEIDAVDDRLWELLNERARLAGEVGKAKHEAGDSTFYRPDRERAILERIVGKDEALLPQQGLRSIYREVISACLAVESPLEVAFLGPSATFTHEAAKAQFGMSARMAPRPSIREVFDDVANRRCDYGVVPVENSLEGVVRNTLDGFVDTDVRIGSEVQVEIHHQLMSLSGHLERIKTIYSHPQAFGQCQNWLQRHLPHALRVEVSSTARAAQLASEEEESAAIASDLAADLYGLQVVARQLEDQAGNLTRFWVLGLEEPEPSGDDKTSLVFTLPDESGALHRALAYFSDINLSRIESRPSRRKAWEYLFVDLEGHRLESPVREALDALEAWSAFFRILGSYPRWQPTAK